MSILPFLMRVFMAIFSSRIILNLRIRAHFGCPSNLSEVEDQPSDDRERQYSNQNINGYTRRDEWAWGAPMSIASNWFWDDDGLDAQSYSTFRARAGELSQDSEVSTPSRPDTTSMVSKAVPRTPRVAKYFGWFLGSFKNMNMDTDRRLSKRNLPRIDQTVSFSTFDDLDITTPN